MCEYGMSDKLGHLTLGRRHGQIFLGRDFYEEERNYSDETAQLIDTEVKKIVESCYKRAKDLLIEHKDKLDKLVNTLLEKEVLDGEEVKKIVGLQKKEKIEQQEKV